MFRPRYRITATVAKALMGAEADRAFLSARPLSAPLIESLRRSARLLSTHLSTRIEGNRLTPDEVAAVVEGEGTFPGRERDEAEVRHYFAALAYVERLGRTPAPLAEKDVRTIHGLVMTGKARATPYRDGQNVIRDGRTGRTVYLPPEAQDVPHLMAELVDWVNEAIVADELPVPVVAGLAHYQFATVHPYFDGNGRTARLLTNLLLHRNGYGLNGIYSLEEYYADNLNGYYDALARGKSHNYYRGRAEADVTPFVAYFCLGLANAFATIRARAERESRKPSSGHAALLRVLTPQQRTGLGLFRKRSVVTSADVAKFFRYPARKASALCAAWARDGFLAVVNPSTKGRSFRLGVSFQILLDDR